MFIIVLVGHSTSSIYDYFCEASKVTGFESAIRALPSAEAKIISVGQQPMVALYKLNKASYVEAFMHKVGCVCH